MLDSFSSESWEFELFKYKNFLIRNFDRGPWFEVEKEKWLKKQINDVKYWTVQKVSILVG